MSLKPMAIAASVTLISAILLAFLTIDPLKRAWWGYLNDHASEYYIRQMLAFNARKDLNLPAGSVLFYGDSMVQGLAVASASDMAVNYGIGQATSEHVALQLRNHQNVARAKAVVIAVGINDIAREESAQVLPNYRAAIQNIPETVPVIISQIMPVDEEDLQRLGLSQIVNTVNTELDQLCASSPRIECLNAGTSLADDNGQLKRQYHTGDGLHLNARGNKIWLQQLRLAIENITGNKNSIEQSPGNVPPN